MIKSNKIISFVLSVLILLNALVLLPITKVNAVSQTREEAVNWANSQIGKYIDADGAYGNQCVDLIMAYYQYLGVSKVSGHGYQYATNALPSGWTRIQNTPSFVPEPGDIVVWNTSIGGGYGHVAIFVSGDTNSFVSIDQNWPKGTSCKKVTHNYNSVWGVVRPDFSEENTWYNNLSPVDLGTDFYAKITTSNNHRDVCNSSGNVDLYESCDEPNHVWYFIRQSDGAYKIKNAYGDNGYMDVYESRDENVNVQVWEGNDSPGQYWYIYTINGYNFFLRPKCSDRVLDVYGGNNNIGDNIGIWTFNGAVAQTFNISKVPFPYTTMGDDFYAKIISSDAKLELTATNGNVDINKKSESQNHIWHFLKQSDNTYKIVNMSGGVLDVEGNADSNSNVQVWSDNGNDCQRWYIYDAGEGYSYLKPKCADRLLDVNRALYQEGTNVGVFTFNGQNNQKFVIKKVLYPYENIGTDFYAKIATLEDNKEIVANGGEIEISEASNDKNHIWFFSRKSDGSYRISNLQNNDSYMDVFCSGDNNNDVIIWSNNEGENQDWYIYKDVNGSVRIMTKYSYEFLELVISDQENMMVNALNDTDTQRFYISKLKPINTEISIDKEVYGIDENIHINVSADCGVQKYVVNITNSAGDTILKEFVDGDISISAESLGVGDYCVFVSCTNTEGTTNTDSVNFSVIEMIKKGDVNSDKVVNMKDIVLLQQYLNNWDVGINTDASDVNNDGVINMKDIVLLQQYMNGWDVELV